MKLEKGKIAVNVIEEVLEYFRFPHGLARFRTVWPLL